MITTLIRRFSLSSTLRAHIDPGKIGTREVVGWGMNGQAIYVDSSTFPYPAIRYKEITPAFKALREKEKGDWRTLSLSEKKCLYRVSFCQTFTEMEAPTGEWKSVVGFSFMILAGCVMLYLLTAEISYYNPLPETYKRERQEAQMERIINARMNPVCGISSKWDYEKNTWKE